MPSPIRSKELQKTKLLSIEMEFPVQKWREELEFLRQETRFYQNLLHIGQQSGSGPGRRQLNEIRKHLSKLVQDLLPEMFLLLEGIKDSGDRANEITRSYFLKQETFQQDFRRLKSQIFPVIDEFQSISIW